MDRVKISDLQVGDRIIGTYAVKSKSLQEFKSKPGKFLTHPVGIIILQPLGFRPGMGQGTLARGNESEKND